MASISNNHIAYAIYSSLKDKKGEEYTSAIKDVVKFLISKKLISKSAPLLQSLKRIINKEENIIEANIESGDTLNSQTKKDLVVMLTKRYKAKDVFLKEKVDERLKGGFKIEVEDEIIDFTILNKLKKLEAHLTR